MKIAIESKTIKCTTRSFMKEHLVKRTINVIAFFSILFVSATAGEWPFSYLIPNTTAIKQINALECGAGSLAIAFDAVGPVINEREIVDVARTSSTGTYTFDIVRAGHFSELSAAQGAFYPNSIPAAGYTGRPLGYATFSHSAATSWMEEAKALVAQNIPVIMLMHFSPGVTENTDGHYRVLVGYNDVSGIAIFQDPWQRDNNHRENPDGTISFPYADVIQMWSITEGLTNQSYFGSIAIPLRVTVTSKGALQQGKIISINARIEYPCFAPFDCSAFPASHSSATIELPPCLTLAADQSLTQSLGSISAGTIVSVSFKAVVTGICSGSTVTVTASGLVSGSVPDAPWQGNVLYPTYSYTDRIGGRGALVF
jgi:hypothetical protein